MEKEGGGVLVGWMLMMNDKKEKVRVRMEEVLIWSRWLVLCVEESVVGASV